MHCARIVLGALAALMLLTAPAAAGPKVTVDTKHLTVLVGKDARVSVLPRGVARARTVRAGRTARIRLTASGRRRLAACALRRITVVVRPRGGRTLRIRRTVTCARFRGNGEGNNGAGHGNGGGTKPHPSATPDPTPTPTPDPTPTPTPDPTPTPTPEAPPPSLPGFVPVPGCDFLDPAVCLLPWPNDYFTRVDPSTPTGRRLDLQLTSMPRNIAGKPIDPTEYNRNDGFSPGTPIVTKVPGLDNDAAFANTGLVPQTDMARAFDADQPAVLIDAESGERQLIWAELDKTAEADADRTLIIRPGKNLAEGRRYIVALRNLRNASGTTIPAQRPFVVYRDKIRTLDPIVEDRRPHMEDIFATLTAAGITRRELYLAWDFTVASEQDRTERARHIRDDAFAELGDTDLADLEVDGAAPAYTVTGVEPTPTDTRISAIVDGTFTVPCYLNLPDCRPGSRFAYGLPTDTLPTRIPGNTMEAHFRCIVPRSASAANPPRVSLYGHGLFGTRSEVGQGQLRSLANEQNIVFCATDWIGMSTAMPPGEPEELFGDIPFVATILTDLSGFPMLADRVQQGLLNFMYLGRLLVHPDGLTRHAAFGPLDQERLYYDGNSQGGIIGGALMALIPDAQRGVLGVPAMNYSTLLNRSVDFEMTPGEPCPGLTPEELELDNPESVLDATNFSYACPMYAAYPSQLERQLLFSLIQQLWDRAEANGYALHMTDDPLENTPPHEVLMHVALGDHQVAQVAAEVEARTIGAHTRPTPVDADRTYDVEPLYGIPRIASYPFSGSVYELWDSGPVRDGGGTAVAPVGNVPPREGDDPHEEPRNTLAARNQKGDFLRPDGVVNDYCNGGPCYSR